MGRWTEQIKEKQKSQSTKPSTYSGLDGITLMKFSEFARRNMATEIYSEILGCTTWLCSNEEMAAQIKKDDPEAVCYTVDELREFIRLSPTPEDIKRIHEAKSVFHGSKIIESKLREESDEDP